MIEQRFLEYILVLAETGNMTQAAKKLYVSQPTLSQFLTKQETKIGTPLFRRCEGRYVLTPVGELYAEYGRKILALTDTLEKDVRRMSAGIHINIGNSASHSLQMLTAILTDFRAQYPNVELTMSDRNFNAMSHSIARNELDIAFVTAPPLGEYNGRCFELKKEEVLFATPRRSSPGPESIPQKNSGLSAPELLEQFGGSPFILQPEGTCIRMLISQFFESLRFDPIIAFSTTHAQSVFDMVAGRIGSGFIPAGYAVPSPDITYYSLQPKMYRVHYILYREDAALLEPCKYLIELAGQYVEKDWQTF